MRLCYRRRASRTPFAGPRQRLARHALFFIAIPESIRNVSGPLLGRVYHGSLSMLVSAMTREETLPQEEIDELYALLNEMEAKKRRD